MRTYNAQRYQQRKYLREHERAQTRRPEFYEGTMDPAFHGMIDPVTGAVYDADEGAWTFEDAPSIPLEEDDLQFDDEGNLLN